MRDVRWGNRLVVLCQRSGNTKKQKQEFGDIPCEAQRKDGTTKSTKLKSSNFKCGCDWKLKIVYRKELCYCEFLQASLVHTNGCVPSKEQLRLAESRRGSNIKKIPRFLVVMLEYLFKGNSDPCEIRDLIREHHILSDQQSMTPQALINIKLAIQRRAKDVEKSKKFFMNVDVVTVPEVTEDERISLDRFARDWMKSALAKGKKNVVKLLRSLNENDSTVQLQGIY